MNDSNDIRINKINESLARNKISFKSVLKFYFQWFIIIAGHGALFFYFPMAGNEKLNNKVYCDPDDEKKRLQDDSQTSEKNWCNNLNENRYIWIFYLILCLYMYISAL